jgi:hypothetical protein
MYCVLHAHALPLHYSPPKVHDALLAARLASLHDVPARGRSQRCLTHGALDDTRDERQQLTLMWNLKKYVIKLFHPI